MVLQLISGSEKVCVFLITHSVFSQLESRQMKHSTDGITTSSVSMNTLREPNVA